MKLASYMTDGKSAFGVVTGDGVITLNDRLRARYPTLRDALAGGALEEIRTTAQSARPDRRLSEVRFLPAIPNPEKILCVGINYKSHAAEHGQEAPKLPNIFTRFVNTLVAHEGEMVRPKVSTSFDFEGELAVIIGRGGRHIAPRERARSCRRLYLLLRRHRARLHQILAGRQQELLRHRPARALDRDRGRDSRSDRAHARPRGSTGRRCSIRAPTC